MITHSNNWEDWTLDCDEAWVELSYFLVEGDYPGICHALGAMRVYGLIDHTTNARMRTQMATEFSVGKRYSHRLYNETGFYFPAHKHSQRLRFIKRILKTLRDSA